jgi:hypothetical protein
LLPPLFLLLLAVYLVGAITGAYSYGRVVSYLALVLQMTIAIDLYWLELKISEKTGCPETRQVIFSLGVSALLVALGFNAFVSPLLETIPPEETNPLEKYFFLSQYTGQEDVILTQLPTSMVVPTFGGKVVAFDRPLAFVPDASQRRQDVLRFFDPLTSQAERQKILAKYGVGYILLEKNESSNWEQLRPLIAPFGKLIYRGKRFLLYQVNLAAQGSSSAYKTWHMNTCHPPGVMVYPLQTYGLRNFPV